MSSLFFFASDQPFEEIKNPHHSFLSAKEMEFLNNMKPKSKGDTIIDPLSKRKLDNGLDDDFAICPFKQPEGVRTQKKYTARLDWPSYSKGRAVNIQEYIRKHLLETDAVEIWHIWVSEKEKPMVIKSSLKFADFTPETMKLIEEINMMTSPPTHYCYTITKE